MPCRSLIYLLILSLLTPNLFAQITFNSPLSQGTTCTTTVLSSGLRLDCSGKGYITADSLLDGPVTTYMYVTVLSANVPVGVGLGQRLDPNCLSSMLPETGTTWKDCTSCDLYKCYYNKLTTYTDSTLASSVQPRQAIKVGKKYNWQMIPAPSSGQCWKITISSTAYSPFISYLNV